MSDTDLIKLYSRRILALAADIPHARRLDHPTATARKRSPLCGSTVTVDVVVKDGRIAGFGQDVKACALGQAVAGILGEHIVGATVEEVERARDQLRAMLKDGGPAPTGRFADLALLEQVKDYPARHASTLVAIEAAAEAARKALERTSTADAA